MKNELHDWSFKAQEYSLHFSRPHLWLQDTDGDWHSPLTVTLRPRVVRNKRKRTSEGYARRNARALDDGRRSRKDADRPQPKIVGNPTRQPSGSGPITRDRATSWQLLIKSANAEHHTRCSAQAEKRRKKSTRAAAQAQNRT